MPDDQMRLIQRVVEDLRGRRAAVMPCATFAVAADRRAWVQVTRDAINASYPYSTEPDEWLELVDVAIPSGARVRGWKAGTFVELGPVDGLDAVAIARCVDALFVRLLKQDDPGYALDASVIEV
jgi:hypothetical protein